jgi:hypothetical protein
MFNAIIETVPAKHLKTAGAYLLADRAYHQLVNSGADETPKGERVFNRALELWAELPKTVQRNISRAYFKAYGYPACGA